MALLQGRMSNSNTHALPPLTKSGILPKQEIDSLVKTGAIQSEKTLEDGQVQPASLDLRLGHKAYRLRASFLPGAERTISACLDQDLVMHEIDLSNGAVLETGCVYLVPLQETLTLPASICAHANPKSSTGRLDVFTRVIADHADQFEAIPHGYQGPLYVEIAPRTFSVLARPGDKLVQIRFRHQAQGDPHTPSSIGEQIVSIDLKGLGEDGIIGWRARRHSGVVDLSKIAAHKARNYWEPLYAPNGVLILDPDEFYILASKEDIQIPPDQAAEMAPIAPEIGEFRAHYAGFFDPGFGMKAAGGAGSRAVLEVRGRDVPFMLRHAQPIAKLNFEQLTAPPVDLYGQNGSHYQAQTLRLSKHFKLD